MKKLKRITALILSVLMLMSMSVAVSATSNPTAYPIYISNSVDGYVYTAYQIFSGELGKDADDNDVLKVPEWSTGINTTDIYTKLAELTLSDGTTKPFTFADGSELTTAAEVAAKLAQYTDTYDSEAAQLFADFIADYVVGVTASYSSNDTQSGGYYTISAPAGYYLIKNTKIPDDAGKTSATRYILAMTTTSGSTTDALEIKSDYPNLDKDLDETIDADAGIGDTITYYLTASLPTDTYDYYNDYNLVFHDTLSVGLDFEKVVAVYVYDDADRSVNESNASQQLTSEAKEYTTGYAVNDSPTDGCSFEVSLDAKDFTTNGNALIQVVVEATLTEKAETKNTNSVYLEYSNDMYSDNTGKSVTDVVITWTYELDVTKIDADTKDTANEKELDGAEFILYKVDDSGNTLYLVVDNGTVSEWVDDSTKASTLISDNGKFSVFGLDVGTYYLEETKAPSGYNRLSGAVKIVIAAEHITYEKNTWLTDDATDLDSLTITMTFDGETTDGEVNTTDGTVAIKVTNNTGAALPSTGGIGTTIFYIVGGVLVVGAIILLITKKRMGGDDK